MRAREILEGNRSKVEMMAKALMEWETLDANQIEDIMSGREPRPPAEPEDKPTSPSGKTDSPDTRPEVKPRFDKPAGDQP